MVEVAALSRDESDARAGLNSRVRAVRYHLDLLLNLAARDTKARFKGSILGMFWSLLNPIALIMVYSFLFTRVISLGIGNYVAFLAAGILPWNWFVTSLDSCADSLLANRDLVKKTVFPSEMLLVATVTSNLLFLAMAVPVLLVYLLITNSPITLAIAWLPVIAALQFSFILGLGLVVSTLNVYFRDVRHLLGVVLFAWFFLTPVFYADAVVPVEYRPLYSANPMAHIINAYREVLLFGRAPDATVLAQLAFFAALVLTFGLILFRRYKSGFAEEL